MPTYDLTHLLTTDMPVFPGDPVVRLTPAAAVETDGCALTALSFGSHSGTHMDAPAHMLAGASTLDALPVENFIGSATVVDCSSAGAVIGSEWLKAVEPVDFVLFSTGWARHWGTPGYFNGYPALAPELAEALIGRGARGVGLDTPSADAPDGTDHPIHHKFCTAGLVIVENLTGLQPLAGKRFTFCALPLHYKNADGAPVRAVAICPEVAV